MAPYRWPSESSLRERAAALGALNRESWPHEKNIQDVHGAVQRSGRSVGRSWGSSREVADRAREAEQHVQDVDPAVVVEVRRPGIVGRVVGAGVQGVGADVVLARCRRRCRCRRRGRWCSRGCRRRCRRWPRGSPSCRRRRSRGSPRRPGCRRRCRCRRRPPGCCRGRRGRSRRRIRQASEKPSWSLSRSQTSPAPSSSMSS